MSPDALGDDEHGLVAHECANGHLTIPGHPRCPHCSRPQTGTIALTERTAEVVTWTTARATPPGVREPNTLAIVEFEVDSRSVRTIGQTTGDVSIGDAVEPVFVDLLRDPDAAIRASDSQSWSGYRFEPVE